MANRRFFRPRKVSDTFHSNGGAYALRVLHRGESRPPALIQKRATQKRCVLFALDSQTKTNSNHPAGLGVALLRTGSGMQALSKPRRMAATCRDDGQRATWVTHAPPSNHVASSSRAPCSRGITPRAGCRASAARHDDMAPGDAFPKSGELRRCGVHPATPPPPLPPLHFVFAIRVRVGWRVHVGRGGTGLRPSNTRFCCFLCDSHVT